MNEFSDALHSARKQAGLTQKGLGAEIGVTDSMVCAWERGSKVPAAEDVRRLEEALEVELPFPEGRKRVRRGFWDGDRAKSEKSTRSRLRERAVTPMLVAQNARCPVCDDSISLLKSRVDHDGRCEDHKGVGGPSLWRVVVNGGHWCIRNLLCNTCNVNIVPWAEEALIPDDLQLALFMAGSNARQISAVFYVWKHRKLAEGKAA